MNLEELYKEMKRKLHYMYDNNQDGVVVDKYEFFKLYQVVCYMMQIKHIADVQ